MGERAKCELAGHVIQAGGLIVERRNQRIDRSPSVGGPVHVADVDLVEGRLADAQHQRAFFLEANIGSPLNELRGNAIGDPGQRPHAAGNDDHGIRRVRTAGDVGPNVGVRLLVNLRRRFADDLFQKIAAAAKAKLFGHDAQSAVGGDEVDGLNTFVAFDGQKKLFQKNASAGASSRHGQVLRRVIGQGSSDESLGAAHTHAQVGS